MQIEGMSRQEDEKKKKQQEQKSVSSNEGISLEELKAEVIARQKEAKSASKTFETVKGSITLEELRRRVKNNASAKRTILHEMNLEKEMLPVDNDSFLKSKNASIADREKKFQINPAFRSSAEKGRVSAIPYQKTGSGYQLTPAQARRNQIGQGIFDRYQKGEEWLMSETGVDDLSKASFNRFRSMLGGAAEDLAYAIDDMIGEDANPVGHFFKNNAQKVLEQNLNGRISDTATRQFQSAKDKTGVVGDFFIDMADTASTIAGYSLLGPHKIAAVQAISGGLNEYRTQREQGFSKVDATSRATAKSLVSYYIERIGGIGGKEKAIQAKSLSEELFKTVLKNSAVEGAEGLFEGTVDATLDVAFDTIFGHDTVHDLETKKIMYNSLISGAFGVIDSGADITLKMKAEKAEYQDCVEKLGKNAPKTLEAYRELRYTGEKETFDDYKNSVVSGGIPALVDFESYQKVKKETEQKLIGIDTQKGTKINSVSSRFLKGIIGSIKEKRDGISIDTAQKTLSSKDARVFPFTIEKNNTRGREFVYNGISVYVDSYTGDLFQIKKRR